MNLAANVGSTAPAALRRLIAERTGLAFAENRCEGFDHGLQRAMQRASLTDPEEYRRSVESNGRLFDDLVAEVTIGETYFFRHPGQYEIIRRRILPEIHARRGAEHVVRLWSAACASGEEPYSLAILLAEEHLGDRAHLLATDISRAALARARAAHYRQWSLRNEGAARMNGYLAKRGDQFILADSVRRRVVFEWLNLASETYPSLATGIWGMDLILCRNVLIYFDRETVRRVAERLYASLADGGWLLTAASDPPLADLAPFEVEVTDEGLAYRRPAGPAAVVARDHGACQVLAMEPSTAPVTEAALGKPALREDSREASAQAESAANDAAACGAALRALAGRDPEAACSAAEAAVAQFPLSTEIQYLYALLLLELGRTDEAQSAVRRVLYLDRSLAIVHFTLGLVLERRGDVRGAKRAYRNARDLCAARPLDEVLPLAEGERAADLAEAIEAQIAVLEAATVEELR